MKKISRSHGEHFGPIKIYLDDIVNIESTLEEGGGKVSYETTNYVFDDITGLKNNNPNIIHKLNISTGNPYVSLEMKPTSVWLYISNNDPVSRGLFEKIKAILVDRRRRLEYLLLNPLITGLPLWIGVILTLSAISPFSMSDLLVGLVFLVIGGSLLWLGYTRAIRQHSIIVLDTKANRPSFFRRNADGIFLNILSAIVGGLITLLIAKITGYIQ